MIDITRMSQRSSDDDDQSSSNESSSDDDSLVSAKNSDANDDQQDHIEKAFKVEKEETPVPAKKHEASPDKSERRMSSEEPSTAIIQPNIPNDDSQDEDATKPQPSTSSSPEKSPTPTVRRARANKERLTSEDLENLGLDDAIRRSGRTRKAPVRLQLKDESSSDDQQKSRRSLSKKEGSYRSADATSNDDDDDQSQSSSASEQDSDYTRKKLPKRSSRNAKKKPAKKRKKISSDDDDDSRDSTPNATRGGRLTGRVDYREKASDVDACEQEDEEEEVEYEEQKAPTDIIDRVLWHRIGRKGATGPPTTCYNVADNGDPNTKFDEIIDRGNAERQYLIKFQGWAYLHSTWESYDSLVANNVGGMKKLDNYIKSMRKNEKWLRNADREQREYFEVEQKMLEELVETYKQPARIVAHQKSQEAKSGTEYYVKWQGLPYVECTWEDEALLNRLYPNEIKKYETRLNTMKYPTKACPALKRRPKFTPMASQPDFFAPENEELKLRDYQLDGVNWMIHAWTLHNSGLLADEMGLGKTIQTICFLSCLSNLYDLNGPFLVVVPLSTIAAWEKEFENWAPQLNTVVYIGDAMSRNVIRTYELVSNQRKMKANIIITTFEILLKDKSFLKEYEWAVLMVDEAHRLKNDESVFYQALKSFTTDHRLLITGTPLQNRLKEFWALLHFCNPDTFDSWIEFEKRNTNDSQSGFARLHKEIRSYMLRRTKRDVEKSLPAKVEQILRVDMTSLQKKYYKYILTKNYSELSQGVKGSISGFVNIMMELKKCCNHAHLVRQPDQYATMSAERLQELLKGSGKVILLDKLLVRLKDTGHRVLIFSQFVIMLDLIEEYLKLRQWAFQRLDGSTRSDLRRAALEHFNAPGSQDFCFILSTRAGGLGINLATADTVIIFDSDWNPQNDLQAMSRAHRIGQTKQVNIYRFVTKSSVEEDIIERAKKKLVLDHLVIQRMDTSGRTVISKDSSRIPFDKEELNTILKFGAAELFKDSDDQEPEVDIDNILSQAETRAAEDHVKRNELLDSFKVADFQFDEETDLSNLHAPDKQDWQNIIPEEERRRLEEEEQKETERALEAGRASARKNKTKENQAPDDEEEEDYENTDSSDDGLDGGRSTSKKKRQKFLGFTETEVKRFVRSFRRYADPLARLDDIAAQAELSDHTGGQIKELTEALIKACARMLRDEGDSCDPKSKGPQFTFGGSEIQVRHLMKNAADMEPLVRALPDANDEKALSRWRLPGIVRQQKGWGFWTDQDDALLLRGVYAYGHGAWMDIKMDPSLSLADKILPTDKSQKPQSKHLQARVDYLLRRLSNEHPPEEKEHERRLQECGSDAERDFAYIVHTMRDEQCKSKSAIKSKDNNIVSDDELAESKKKKVKASSKLKKDKDKKKEKEKDTKKKKAKTETKDVVKKDKAKDKHQHAKHHHHHHQQEQEAHTSAQDDLDQVIARISASDNYKTTRKFKINEKQVKVVVDNPESAEFRACVGDLKLMRHEMRVVIKQSTEGALVTCQRELAALGEYICETATRCAQDSASRQRKHGLLWGMVAQFAAHSASDLLDAFRKTIARTAIDKPDDKSTIKKETEMTKSSAQANALLSKKPKGAPPSIPRRKPPDFDTKPIPKKHNAPPSVPVLKKPDDKDRQSNEDSRKREEFSSKHKPSNHNNSNDTEHRRSDDRRHRDRHRSRDLNDRGDRRDYDRRDDRKRYSTDSVDRVQYTKYRKYNDDNSRRSIEDRRNDRERTSRFGDDRGAGRFQHSNLYQTQYNQIRKPQHNPNQDKQNTYSRSVQAQQSMPPPSQANYPPQVESFGQLQPPQSIYQPTPNLAAMNAAHQITAMMQQGRWPPPNFPQQ